MSFRPSTRTSIIIANRSYRFSEHPSAKGMPYGQTGRRATVYQVTDPGGKAHALKVFTQAHRSSRYESMSNSLANFANLPGLQVCARTVLTPQLQDKLLEQYPDLEYAILMPWIQGQTWQEIVLNQQPLSAKQSHHLALHLLNVLSSMEARELAHCDLSGPNVILENGRANPSIALVDVEELFASGLERPKSLPAGSAGYGHKAAIKGLWQANADRFAGAVLLAEILGWRDESVRRIAYGEQFFDPKEIHLTGDRLKVLKDALKRAYGQSMVEIFVEAWFSESLDKCPTFEQWTSALDNGNGGSISNLSKPQPATFFSDSSHLTDAGSYLFDSFKRLLEQGNLEEAEKLSNALLALAPDFSEPTLLLEDARKQRAEEQAVQDELATLRHEYEEKASALQIQHELLIQERGELDTRLENLKQREMKFEDDHQVLNQIKTRIEVLEKGSGGYSQTRSRENSETSNVTLVYKQRKKIKLSEVATLKHKKLLMPSPFVYETLFVINNKIFTLTDDGTAHIWNLLADKEDEWAVTEAGSTVACRSQNGQWLAVGDTEGGIQLLDQTTNKKVRFDTDGHVNALSFAHGKNQLAVGTPAGYSIFSSSGKLIESNSQRDVFSLSFSPDGRYLAWASEDGFLQLLHQGTRIGETQIGADPEILFDPSNQFIYISNRTDTMTKIAVDGLKTVLSFSTVESTCFTTLAISPEGQILATATDEGDIYLWRTGDGRLLETQNAHKKEINSLDFHPSGQYLISGSDDGTAIIWAID